jgi:transposase-like protein
MRYIIYFSQIDPKEVSLWTCPVCLHEAKTVHGPKPHEDFEKIGCPKCGATFLALEYLRARGHNPKRAEAYYKSSSEPLLRARPIDGTQYEVLFTAASEMATWDCPRCGHLHHKEEYCIKVRQLWFLPNSFSCPRCQSKFKVDKESATDLFFREEHLPMSYATRYEAEGGMTICEILGTNRWEGEEER